MALTTLEQNSIYQGAAVAKKLVMEIKPIIDQMNVTYDSAGGVKSTITQEDLDATAGLSGLTKQQLDDAMYALTNTIKTALTDTYSQLAGLASRAVS